MISILVICCLGIILYSDSFNCSFHLDDIPYIINNDQIRDIQNLASIWNYCPCRFVTFFSLAFNYHLHQLHVFGYHLFNIIVHLVSAILVWWLTLLTFSTPVMKGGKISVHAWTVALLAALLFVSHPVQTEAVTYIWQRAASMAAMFYLASLCFYIKSRLFSPIMISSGPVLGFPQRARKLRSLGMPLPRPPEDIIIFGTYIKYFYILSLTTATLAMFTKENTITLPLMILLYEFCFFGGKKGINWKYIFPFLLTIFIIPITMLLTNTYRIREIQGIVEGPEGITPIHYLLTQIRVMITYIRICFFPVNLNLAYDYPVYKSFFEMPVLASFLSLSVVFYLAKRLFLKYRMISFSIFWFFLTLIPESSILPQKDVIFEHRLYLPLVGYCIFLATAAYYILGKGPFKAMTSLLVLIIFCYSLMTYQRNKVWANELTLWDDSIAKSPHNVRAYNNRGIAYYANNDLARASSDFTKAIEIDPSKADAYYNLGFIDGKQGDLKKAIADFTKAIELNPNNEREFYNRGLTFYAQGDFTRATSDYTKAVEINPEYKGAYIDRGVAWENQGDLAQAILDYSKAIEIDPNLAMGYHYRGRVYFKEGNDTKALDDYNKAIALDPDNAQAYNDRGSLHGSQDEVGQAISDFDQAIKISPNYADAYNNRAIAYTALKENDKARADEQKAESLKNAKY